MEVVDEMFSSSYITAIKIPWFWNRASLELSSQCSVDQDWREQHFNRYTINMWLCAEWRDCCTLPCRGPWLWAHTWASVTSSLWSPAGTTCFFVCSWTSANMTKKSKVFNKERLWPAVFRELSFFLLSTWNYFSKIYWMEMNMSCILNFPLSNMPFLETQLNR